MVENLAKPYTDCYKDFNSPELKKFELVQRVINSKQYYSSYNSQSCFSLYYRREQARVCNCSVDVEWEIEGLDSCRNGVYTSCMTSVYNRIIYETDDFNTKVLKECPMECDYTVYSKSVSSGNYATPREIKKQLRRNDYFRQRQQNSTYQEIRETMVYLRVYFDELKYRHLTQIPKWMTADFVSAVGGTIGLFLGMTFMSFFEIFEILFEIVYYFLVDSFKRCKVYLKE